MMKVKVCGITNLEDAKLCCDLGADALGFIFYEKSKRYINFEDASLIVSELPAFISKVGVFVNEEATTVNHIAQSVGLTHVQLHGNGDQHFISQINHPVIKALRVQFCSIPFPIRKLAAPDLHSTGKQFQLKYATK